MTHTPTHVNKLFRITAWPERVPLPPAVAAASYSLDQSGSALLHHSPERAYRSHGETYLAVYALDLEDDRAIVAFANQHAHLDGMEMFLRYQGAGVLVHSELDLAVRTAQLRAVNLDEYGVFDAEPLEDFRFAARVLRDLTSAWRIASGQADPSRIQWQWLDDPSPEAAVRKLAVHLSPLLAGLHPRLHFESSEEAAELLPAVAVEPMPHRKSLFEVCAAELYNHIVANPQYKTCANETCQRLFVLQQGRAVHGQHRTTGVKYCSSNCARAQNQRAYRRRSTGRSDAKP
jgi:hypothetical protein